MPPGIFVRFLATNWCSLVDSGGCRWGKFSALWSRGGGGRATLPNPPPPPPTGLVLRIAKMQLFHN